MESAVVINNIWSREKRPDYLKARDNKTEAKISRQWLVRNRRRRNGDK